MSLRSAALLLLFAACKPAVRGLCSDTSQCRAGSYCALDGICLASSGTCVPACDEGEICSGGACTALKPTLSVTPPGGPISPANAQITVHVDAAPTISLVSLAVEVDSDHPVAQASLSQPQVGDDVVTLAGFAAGVVGNVSVRATLTYRPAGAAADSQALSLAVPATIDAQPPAVSVFVPGEAWVARGDANLEVRATVDDGAGSGARSASLAIDTCPTGAPCDYAGALVDGSSPPVFSFQVPTAAQTAGSEAPLAVTVTATDAAGNSAQAHGALQIDDAPPQIGSIQLVSSPVAGESASQKWFAGGTSAPDVEIAVPVSDSGSGVAAVVLHLTDADVAGPDPAPMPQPDGTVHFLMPASRVHGREGAMGFTVTATDVLHHQAQTTTSILVDALPPTVTQPHVDYTTATPDIATVCNASDSATFACGRQVQSHLLADDKVSVFFDITDCGAGISAAGQPDATAAGATRTFAVSQSSPASASSCANGNKTHHYKFTLDGTKVVLPGADATGTALVQLTGNAVDKVANAASSAVNATTSGDGLAAFSTWRWKRKLNGVATGGPALVPGTAGQRLVAIATDGGSIYQLPADGSAPASASASGVVGDLATGGGGNVYGVTSSFLYIVVGGAAQTCASQGGATLGLPPVVGAFGAGGSSGEQALLLAASHTGANNLFAFRWDSSGQTCNRDYGALAISTGLEPFTGATAGSGGIYAGNQKGFASYTLASVPVATPYNGSVVGAGAPALASGGSDPLFGDATTPTLRLTALSTAAPCSAVAPCWNDVAPAFSPAPSAAPISTPVFGMQTVWAVDTGGNVSAWSQSTGAQNFTPAALGGAASAPVLLSDGSALLVQQDCGVTVVSAAGAKLSLGKVCALPGPTSFGATPFAPAVDDRGNGDGVAYVAAPNSWVFAVETPAAPLLAGSSAWPRPGRDSCNSRNAGSSCQ